MKPAPVLQQPSAAEQQQHWTPLGQAGEGRRALHPPLLQRGLDVARHGDIGAPPAHHPHGQHRCAADLGAGTVAAAAGWGGTGAKHGEWGEWGEHI